MTSRSPRKRQGIGDGVTAFRSTFRIWPVEKTKDATLKAFGKIDILVNMPVSPDQQAVWKPI